MFAVAIAGTTAPSYRDAFADIATARNLLINWADGQATEMALGSGNPKASLGSGTNGDETLTVEAASTIAGMPIQNLPHVPVYVAEASDGTGLVVTTSMDAYGPTTRISTTGRPPR